MVDGADGLALEDDEDSVRSEIWHDLAGELMRDALATLDGVAGLLFETDDAVLVDDAVGDEAVHLGREHGLNEVDAIGDDESVRMFCVIAL